MNVIASARINKSRVKNSNPGTASESSRKRINEKKELFNGPLHAMEGAPPGRHLEMSLYLHKFLHRLGHAKTSRCHRCPRHFRDFHVRLHLAEFVAVVAQFPQNIGAFLCGSGREAVLANGDNT